MPEFTADQLDAIRFRGLDACVVAGPGSGKTTVLVERYRRLIVDHGFEFAHILAITFTEKAAANMKAKIAEQFRYNAVYLRELDQAWIYTIHGFCARLLKENAIAAGIDPRFTVLDARESDDLQMDCINAALDDLTLKRRDDALALIEILQVPKLGPDLKSAYDGIRSAGLSIDQVRRMKSPLGPGQSAAAIATRIKANVDSWPFNLSPTQREHKPEVLEYAELLAGADSLAPEARLGLLYKPPINKSRIPRDFKDALGAIRDEDLAQLRIQTMDAAISRFRSMIFDALERFEALYTERKVARGALDFNDLERHAIQLLRGNDTVRAETRKQFRQIMLDEFQDVNEQQSELVKLIRGEDVFFAVGDSNQSIYGFRHARPDIFDNYRAEVEASGRHSGKLMSNFRSRAGILKFVEALLNSSEGIAPRDLTAGRAFQEKAQPSIEVIRVVDREEDEEDEESNREAKWIAHRVLDLRENLQFRFRDFAVLCRNGESMKPILGEFNRAGIPYVCGRRQSFLVSREGRDIAALLHTIANPRDTIALATVLRSPLIGLSDEALLRAHPMGSSLASGLNQLAFDPSLLQAFDAEDATKVERFLADLKRWRADLQTVPLDVLIVRMLTDSGYVWSPETQHGENVEAFLHLARTKGADRTLLEFLHELESIEKGMNTESDLSDEDQGNCVQVMTAHAAKGLEFPVTIVASLHQGTRRGTASVSFTPEHGLGVKWRNTSLKKSSDFNALEDSWAQANSDEVKRREEHEANRLLYVAMTRAEEHLILTYTVGKKKPQNWAKMVDAFFELTEPAPTSGPVVIARDGFDVSMLVTDSDPPPLSAFAQTAIEADVEMVPRPVPGAQDETAVNVTSLAVFATCPRKYYLQRYLGWSPGMQGGIDANDSDAISAADLGTAVHAVLAGKSGPHPAEATELAEVFVRSNLGQRAARSSKSGREWDFIAEIEGSIVRGSIDLWFEQNGTIEIVDYKTDRTLRVSDYAPQLALYALAIEKAFGKRPSRAWLHFLRHDVVEEVAIDEDSARDLIRRLRRAQDELTFDLNEGPHCYSCLFHRSMCPAGL